MSHGASAQGTGFYRVFQKPFTSCGRTVINVESGGGLVEATFYGEQYRSDAEALADRLNNPKARTGSADGRIAQLEQQVAFYREQWEASARALKNAADVVRSKSAPCVEVDEAMVERGARGLCKSQGWDPDEPVTYSGTRKKCRGKDGRVIVQWELHTDRVRAALTSALNPGGAA